MRIKLSLVCSSQNKLEEVKKKKGRKREASPEMTPRILKQKSDPSLRSEAKKKLRLHELRKWSSIND